MKSIAAMRAACVGPAARYECKEPSDKGQRDNSPISDDPPALLELQRGKLAPDGRNLKAES